MNESWKEEEREIQEMPLFSLNRFGPGKREREREPGNHSSEENIIKI